jgi:hypothetical protein
MEPWGAYGFGLVRDFGCIWFSSWEKYLCDHCFIWHHYFSVFFELTMTTLDSLVLKLCHGILMYSNTSMYLRWQSIPVSIKPLSFNPK